MEEKLKTTKEINNKYAALCAQLGDKILKRETLDQQIKELRAEIEVLNKALPHAEAAERASKAEGEKKPEKDSE